MPKIFIQSETLTMLADAIRKKNGTQDKMSPSQMIDAINNLQVGGGKEKIALKFVAKWSTVSNPEAKVPSNLSFQLYKDGLYYQNITLYADQNWTKDIMVDKFNETSLVNYTISSVPILTDFSNPISSKNGNAFEISYNAKAPAPLFEPVFANNNWEQIASACQQKNVPSTWKVGDERSMLINGNNYEVVIIGKNSDKYEDGSTAPLTFMLKNCYSHNSWTEGSTSGGWESSTVRNTVLNNIYNNDLPQEVKSNIKKVQKQSGKGGYSAGTSVTDLQTTYDRLFLLAESEVLPKDQVSWSYQIEKDTLKQYEYFIEPTHRIKTSKAMYNEPVAWWGRSPYPSNSQYVNVINESGASNSRLISNNNGISFAFCF